MKIKVTNRELKECIANVMERIISEGKSKTRDNGFDKASKRGNRDGEREVYGDGFKSYDKVHKSQKDYYRKNKWGKKGYEEELNEDRLNFTHPEDMDIVPDSKPFIKYNYEYDPSEERNIDAVEIKTDIDEVETELIDSILSNFELVEKDIVDGYITFVVPNNMKEEFIDFLRSEDVNIIE
jgi:hypothetical protein